MRNDGGNFDDGNDNDSGRAFNPRLRAVIPLGRPPVGAPPWRFAPPHWRLIAVAALASWLGIVTARLWPLQNKPGAAITPSMAVPSAITPSIATPSTITRIATTPTGGIDSDVCHAGFPAPQFVVSGPPTVLPPEAPASLGLTVDSAPHGAQLVTCGFAAKSLFSAGRSIDEKTWAMAVSDVADAMLLPPRGFVGPMKLVVALLNLDMSLADRRSLRLQRLP